MVLPTRLRRDPNLLPKNDLQQLYLVFVPIKSIAIRHGKNVVIQDGERQVPGVVQVETQQQCTVIAAAWHR